MRPRVRETHEAKQNRERDDGRRNVLHPFVGRSLRSSELRYHTICYYLLVTLFTVSLLTVKANKYNIYIALILHWMCAHDVVVCACTINNYVSSSARRRDQRAIVEALIHNNACRNGRREAIH